MSWLLNTYGHRVGDYPAWANWARKLLAERDTQPIDTGGARRGWRSLTELAAEQAAESRRERLVI